MLNVFVGSMSSHKLQAVREALDELSIKAGVAGVDVPSGVPLQPEGASQILEGAENRAYNARRKMTQCGTVQTVFMGIENGIVHKKSTRHAIVSDYAEVVLLDDEMVFFANSAGHPVNYGDVEDAQVRGFDRCTVAELTQERTGCDKTDATPHYTGGRMNRVELLKHAVKLALCQWLAGGAK